MLESLNCPRRRGRMRSESHSALDRRRRCPSETISSVGLALLLAVAALVSSSAVVDAAFTIPTPSWRLSPQRQTGQIKLEPSVRLSFPDDRAGITRSVVLSAGAKNPPPSREEEEVEEEHELRRYKNRALGDAKDAIGDTDKQSTGQEILSLAVPALAGLAIDPLMTIADTAFIGRTTVSADALAGVASSTALLSFSFYIFNFLTTSTTPIVASRRASGDEDGAVAVGGQAISLALLLGGILCVVLIALSQPLLEVMGTGITGAEANDYATSFLSIRALAAPAVLGISASTGVLRGYFDTKTPLVILLLANIVNFVLDVVLITGAGLGPTGAAIATTTAEWIAVISFLGVLGGNFPSADGELGSNQNKDREDGNTSPGKLLVVRPSLSIPPWEEVKLLVVASSTVFLRSIVLQTFLSGAAAMAARNGAISATASAAAHQIALQLWLLCSFVCDALAAASQALIADSLGREDAVTTRSVSNTIFAYSLGLGVILSVALLIGTKTGFLLDLFSTVPEVQTALGPLLALIIFAQPLNSFVFAADGVLQGASEFPYQAKTMALSVWIAVSSFIGFEYFGFGEQDTLVHVWYSLIVLQSMRGLTSLLKCVDSDGPIDLLGGQGKNESVK